MYPDTNNMRVPGRLIGHRLLGWSVVEPGGWLVGWSVGRLVGRLVGRAAGRSAGRPSSALLGKERKRARESERETERERGRQTERQSETRQKERNECILFCIGEIEAIQRRNRGVSYRRNKGNSIFTIESG